MLTLCHVWIPTPEFPGTRCRPRPHQRIPAVRQVLTFMQDGRGPFLPLQLTKAYSQGTPHQASIHPSDVAQVPSTECSYIHLRPSSSHTRTRADTEHARRCQQPNDRREASRLVCRGAKAQPASQRGSETAPNPPPVLLSAAYRHKAGNRWLDQVPAAQRKRGSRDARGGTESGAPCPFGGTVLSNTAYYNTTAPSPPAALQLSSPLTRRCAGTRRGGGS